MTPSSDTASPSDLVRQIGVISATCFMIVAAMVGTGLFGGTNVRDLQGGALDADATVLAPDRPAFGIWTVIYLLMIGYTVWQALPGQRARERQRAAGWWVAASAVLNGGWLLASQFLNLVATVVAIILLLVVLGATLRVLSRHRPDSLVDVVLLDGTVGLHLGWVSLATVANITAWLTTEVAPPSWAAYQDGAGIAVLVVVALVGLALAWRTGGRIAPALAMAWGLVWIGVARTTGEPASNAVGITAFVVAAVVLIAAVAARLSSRGRSAVPR
ncbi:TspO/MBR family protein [Microbacterium sp. TNHR37B]|uniref:TspO/MBR family protein n=1 Tax=Microbacterium sp. TNHR37B TaxID=1775956 RepID=UPI0007B21A26|nr:TspO/MBR family protein [Microbacterium sp. TNHR37B]KZE89371.1 hypothetical protein AVP41_02165 [Microbacterium sp. TNHR37B]